jgi:hypothetical protein
VPFRVGSGAPPTLAMSLSHKYVTLSPPGLRPGVRDGVLDRGFEADRLRPGGRARTLPRPLLGRITSIVDLQQGDLDDTISAVPGAGLEPSPLPACVAPSPRDAPSEGVSAG